MMTNILKQCFHRKLCLKCSACIFVSKKQKKKVRGQYESNLNFYLSLSLENSLSFMQKIDSTFCIQ